MLKTSVASILALTVVLALALLASTAPAAPAVAESPLALQKEGQPQEGGWMEALRGLWHGLFGGEVLEAMSGTSCNAVDPCATNACNPEQCTPCSNDPCAANACNPSACNGGGGGDGGGQGGRFEPGG